PVAAQMRVRRREERVAGGMAELRRWLDDQVQQGLAAAEGAGYRPFETMAARLVDAQAPAAAAAVRRMGGIVGIGPQWADRLLGEMGLLRLLVAGHDRLAELPPGPAATVRTRIGFPVSSEDVLAGPRTRDRWQVLGLVDSDDGTLMSRRIWLRGASTGRFALLLSFAAAGQSLQSDVVPGTELDADLTFYPGAFPLRAWFAERHGVTAVTVPSALGVADALAGWSAALAAEPWRHDVPVLLGGVRPAAEGWLVDLTGAALPLAPGHRDAWWLLAAAGGQPATVAAEWSSSGLRPLSAWVDGHFVEAGEAMPDGGPRRGPELPPDLLAAALVGSARRPWQATSVTVGGQVLHTGGASLLETAAAAVIYHRAGVAAEHGHEPIAAAPAETSPPLP
ncbi:SWIM zinc finger family protein, partial [Actinoplanes sp. NPDC051633]